VPIVISLQLAKVALNADNEQKSVTQKKYASITNLRSILKDKTVGTKTYGLKKAHKKLFIFSPLLI
jgi:hypothetical protein